jgi:hypothetical protein
VDFVLAYIAKASGVMAPPWAKVGTSQTEMSIRANTDTQAVVPCRGGLDIAVKVKAFQVLVLQRPINVALALFLEHLTKTLFLASALHALSRQ